MCKQMFKNIFKKLFNNPDNSISFKQGFDLTELPIITLNQGEKKFNLLLDTGSNDSIIDKNVLKHLEYTPLKEKSFLMGLEGNKQEVCMCSITFSHKDKDYPYSYIIRDMSEAFGHIKRDCGVNLHGIIGAKFFNKFKYVLDFDELIAYSKV